MIKIDTKYRNKPGIYKLTISKHIYIGSSINVYKRILRHFSDLKYNKHDNDYLQRSVNKYGLENLKYEILLTFDSITIEELLKFEKYYIDFYNADLNLKKDPITQQNCITTSKVIYQFNRFGEFIKEWESISEACRHLNIDVSNVVVAASNPKRQKIAAGYLWSYEKIYPYPIEILYVFDLNGKFLERYYDTTQLLSLFPNVSRKTLLSQIRKRIDSNIPYKNIYISTNKCFKIPKNYVAKYREPDELDKLFATNPIIYVYDRSNNLLAEQKLSTFNNIKHVKLKIRNGNTKYRLEKIECYKVRTTCIIATDTNGISQTFNTAIEAAVKLFNDKTQSRNIYKHIKSNKPFKGYLFTRDL